MTLARSLTVTVCAFSLSMTTLAAVAQVPTSSAVLNTEQVAALAQNATLGHQQRLASLFDRDDVVAALQERGVDVAAARARVAALTDAEAAELQQHIDSAPAGAVAKWVVVGLVVFVVLMITDYLGLTRIFPFIRPIR
jgi:hypothetical protein